MVTPEQRRARAVRAAQIVALVAAKHLVSVKAVAGKHKARLKHHAVMARFNAAFDLRVAGFEWKEISAALGMAGHPAAIHAARRWEEISSPTSKGGEA